MNTIFHSRLTRFSSLALLASACLLAALTVPPLASARPQSAGAANPAQPQQAQDPAKQDPARKDSAPATPVSAAAAKTKTPKTHRVLTNDDFSSSSGTPIAPGARRRLKQLNRCDRACFVEVEKQALGWGYSSAFPRSNRQDMEDRLANDIEELQNDPKWQRLLLEMISSHIDSCLLRRDPENEDAEPSQNSTRSELDDEAERLKNYKPPRNSNYNAAGSAVLSYRFNSKPDPLRASLMVHQYMDELHRDCPEVLPSNTNSDADSDDP